MRIDRRHQRNAAGTRRAILDAARIAFTLHGFDQAGVREITRAAGVNGSLVNRYFGSKELLFAEAMQIGLGFDTLGDGSAVEVARLLADFAVQNAVDRDHFDPILALIRSAPISRVQPILRDYIAREAVAPLARILGGDDASERASLIVAFLIGVVILRSILESEPLASTKRDDIVALLERILVAGDPPGERARNTPEAREGRAAEKIVVPRAARRSGHVTVSEQTIGSIRPDAIA